MADKNSTSVTPFVFPGDAQNDLLLAELRQVNTERDALRARLAEIEAQEPVATAWMKGGAMVNAFNRPPAAKFDHDGYWTSKGYSESPLYARPVPAQAVPDADGARIRWLCEDHSDRETRERCRSLIDRLHVMSYSDAVMSIDAAIDAIRTEPTQRLTLQHHACDLAQRVADLEAERDEWKRIASAYSTQKELSKALEQAKASGRQARNERDDLRTKYDELLVALHGIGAALGIPEGDRSPYSVTCGVLERVNRLAEIEAQEPVALVETSGDQGAGIGWSGAAQPVGAKLYASPVPAQAAPDKWRLVPVEPTIAMCIAGDSPRMLVDDCTPTPAIYRAMCAAAPEHKA